MSFILGLLSYYYFAKRVRKPSLKVRENLQAEEEDLMLQELKTGKKRPLLDEEFQIVSHEEVFGS